MQAKDPLFEYIEKMKNVMEYLAYGNDLETFRDTTINLNYDMVDCGEEISIVEVNDCDSLEMSEYNELDSIKRIIEFINEGDYDVYEKYKSWDKMLQQGAYEYLRFQDDDEEDDELDEMDEDFDGEYMELVDGEEYDGYYQDEEKQYSEESHEPKENQTYKAAMKRFKVLITKIVFQLYSGLEVNLKDCDIDTLKIDDIQMDVEGMCLIYDANERCFRIMQGDNVILENISPASGLDFTVKFLYNKEMERKMHEYKTGKLQKEDYTYRGFPIGKEKDER